MGGKTSIYEPVHNNYECNTVSSVNQRSSCGVPLADEIFDSFTLIWLDIQSKGNDLDSLKTKNLLLETCKDCLFYENCDLFFHDVDEKIFENKKNLLIVSGPYVEIVLSRWDIKDIISAAVIFCRDAYKYTKLKKDFIIDLCTDRKSLKTCIIREMSSLKLNLFENQPLQSVRLLSSCTEDGANSGVYFKYILFIELLKQLPQTEPAKETMLMQSEDYYRAQKKRLREINEFREKYTKDKALKWYTNDTFLYRLVNLAFRTEDISLWYTFRFYVTDLCMQLEKVHREQELKFGNRRLTLYRGQSRMLTTELKNIKSRIQGLVATTGFFSTSYDRVVAMEFVSDPPESNDFKAVLFEIIVDTSNVKNVIFADVLDYLSSRNEATKTVRDEREVLFNIGSVFKVLDVEYDANMNLWIIKMEGTDEGTNTAKDRITSILEKIQIRNINLLFGQQMLDMCYYVAADYYFKRMLQELPRDHKDLASVYDLIGDMKMRVTNWNEAFENFNHAYMIKQKAYRCVNHPDLGLTLNNIGNYYKAIENNDLALDFYRKALKCVTDQFNIAITKLNIGTILAINEQYLQALEIYREAYYVLQKIEPWPNAAIIVCHGLIGDIHLAKHEYDHAEALYTTAFNLAKKFLFIDDHRLTQCIEALATIYQKQDNGDNKRAMDFCEEQLLSYEKDLPENHVTIAHIFMILGKLSGKIDFYKRALSIFERNISQEYASTANCLILMAKYYDEQNKSEEDLSFYRRAYEIQRKIYPSNHSVIVESDKLLGYKERKLWTQSTI